MDRTPSRRQRYHSPEQSAALTTPVRLSSGRRRSLSALSPDVFAGTTPVPEKKKCTSIGRSASETVPHFSALLDRVAATDSSCPAPVSNISSVLIVQAEKDGVDFVFNGEQYRVADPAVLESLLAQQQTIPPASKTVGSLRAAQRATYSSASRKLGHVASIPQTPTDADAALSSLDQTVKFVKQHSTPEAEGTTGPSLSRLLVTRSTEDGVEFTFEGSAYRATDPIAIQALASVLNSGKVQHTTVSSLRAAQRVGCLSRESAAPWLWAPPVSPKNDVQLAASQLKHAWSFVNVRPIQQVDSSEAATGSKVRPSSQGSLCPLLILNADGDGVDFVCDGSVCQMAHSEALLAVLAKSQGPPSVRSLSTLRAAQSATRGQHVQPLQSMPEFAQPNGDADIASRSLASAISFVKSASNTEASDESFDPKSKTSGALLCTHADAECTEFVFEGKVYRVRKQDAFETSIARRECSQPKRSVSSILAAQRAARGASAKV